MKLIIILTVFISWLNMDLGIEVCFYNGFEYSYLYMASIPISILCLHLNWSRYCVSRELGSNPVAVSLTLLLMSYTKTLHTAINSLTYTSLEYSNGTGQYVWLYSGDISYFKSGKHITLAMFAIFTHSS